MSVQSEFLAFNDRIRTDYSVKKELREKRDILLKLLRDSGKLPSFSELNQGSYSMFTGVEPLDDKEYDIDVGLRFNVNVSEYEPMDLKNTIHEILRNHTDYGAKIKKPCVTVTYKKDGEAAYHVDLVVYTYADKDNHDSQLYLARGKESTPDEIRWEKSDPKGLIDYINNAVDSEDAEQYRRVIRYLKRWKNLKFSSVGHAEPASIGITLIAADDFVAYANDDLSAVLALAKRIEDRFCFECYSEDYRELYRIVCPMPESLSFEDDTDAFCQMSDSQMTDFRDKLQKLIRDLEAVQDEADEVEKCKKLNKIFGDDFKVPSVASVSKRQQNYIPSTSASGD